MRTLKYLITAAMAAALAFASCTKEIEAPEEPGQEEESYSRETGKPVVFGVSIKKDKKPDTKTEYSEEIFTSIGGKLQKIGEVSTGYEIEPDTKAQYEENDILYGGLQRINWELNDRIGIILREGTNPPGKPVEYRISEIISNLANISSARIEKVGEGLKWGEELYHRFTGIYPNKSTGHPIIPGDNQIVNTIHTGIGLYIITKIPNIQYSKGKPIMCAFTKVEKNSDSPVQLIFSPEVNTFEITVKNSRPNDINIKSIRLENIKEYISGNCQIHLADVNSYECVIASKYIKNDIGLERYKTVEHFCGPSGKTLNPNKEFSVRLYTFPMDIENLCLVIEETDGTKTALELKDRSGQWIKFKAKKKYRISGIRIPENPGTTHTYTFEVSRNGVDTLRFQPIPLLYPSKRAGGAPINNPIIRAKSYKTEIISGVRTPVPWTINTTEGSDYRLERDCNYEGSISELEAPIPIESCINLELLPDDRRREYNDVISAELKNRIPENYVYDLSREGGLSTGIRNTANCYRITKNGEYKFPLIYGNCIKDNQINFGAFTNSTTGGNILNNFVDGAGNIINETNYKVSTADSVEILWVEALRTRIEDLKLIQENEERYIYFLAEKVRDYGNFIIAVKNSSGKILWTWHIWIVPDLEEGLQPGQISKRPLGYKPDRGGLLAHSIDLELIQKDIRGLRYSIPFKYQRTYSQESCVYYNYGRMTPSIPTRGEYYKENLKNITTLQKCYRVNYEDGYLNARTFLHSTSLNELGISESISSAGTISKITPYQNLWRNIYNGSSQKTVYDPCPAGYRVPRQSELNNLSTSFVASIPKYGAIKDWEKSPINYNNGLFNIYIDGFTEKVYMLSSDRTYREYPAEGTQVKYAPIFPIKE